MRRRLPLVLALPATAMLLGLSAAPAFADVTIPTTPVPGPASPGQPPASVPNNPRPLGHAVGDAATGLAVIRLLPNSTPTQTIIPGYSDSLPKQSAAEVGFGLSSAQANSEAFLAYEHSVAQASPGGIAIEGDAPQAPGSLVQTASPDNAQPVVGGLTPPSTPLDALLKVGLLNGQVHARWSDTLGPCVGTISDASTSIASLSALNVIPTLPGVPLTGGTSTDLSKLLPAGMPGAQQLIDAVKSLTGPLSSLGGLLGTGANGSLLSLPNTLSDRSVVKLVDLPGSKNKAVQSTSTLQVASLNLLGGMFQINVVSQPTLTVTSTGDPKTSTVKYTAPVLQVKQNGQVLFTLDAANPTGDLPIGVPLPDLAAQLPAPLKNLPLVGNLGALLKGTPLASQASALNSRVLDLGVIRLSIAELNQKGQAQTAGQTGAPFTGYQLGATARMLDLQILPTDILKVPGLPSALAQVSLGEQVARAYAPKGGVVCGSTTTGTPVAPPGGHSPGGLAYTNAAYHAVPIFWTGTAMLLVGVVLVAALPTQRPRLVTKQRPPTTS